VHLDHVRMPAGNGRKAEKMKEEILNVLSAIKMSIVKMKAGFFCLAPCRNYRYGQGKWESQVQII
jgi:hypothetical protein